jgi:signal transduction histidine kinase
MSAASTDSYALTVTPRPEQIDAAVTRTADLATFARGVVHDLRNPLNVVVANLYLLRQRMEGAEPRALRPVERISDQVKVLENLLSGYLAFDQATHPAMQRLQVNEVARSVLDSTMVSEGVRLQFEPELELPPVQADPRLIEAVLRAIVRNAVRSMTGEGTVRVETCLAPGAVLLAVQDTGPGIAQDVLPRVFDPFFSTWEEHAGLGLPLAAVVAQAHGGSCRVRSTPGRGTVVELQLPLIPDGDA